MPEVQEQQTVALTPDEMALIRAALSAYMAGIRETQKSILGADREFAEVRTALRSLHTRFFQVNRPEGRRF